MSSPAQPALASRLYACRVLHERFAPKRHRFAYRLFYLALDLDELPALHRRLWCFSVNRPNLFSFWERDYLPSPAPIHQPTGPAENSPAPSSLKERVLAYCASQGTDLGPGARIALVTLPRVFGHAFNPVSFYLCCDSAGALRCAIAAVTNTFHETKLYFLPRLPAASGPAACGARMPKHFYVSPFSDLEVAFDFRVHAPGRKLAVVIDDYEAGRLTLHSTLGGDAEPLTGARLLGRLLRSPAVLFRVLTLIHWQALRLWLKRIPHFRKADRADLQRDVRHPHSSLTRHSPA